MRTCSIIFISLIISVSILSGQNETDALRFSRQLTVGTARSVGLGGAMGAVGADFTSLSINPAGLALYRGSEVSFSPSLSWDNTSSNFLGNSYDESKYNFNIGNLGFVSTYDMNREKGWISTNFGLGYNQNANYNRNILMSGINRNSSLLDNFTDYANQFPNSLNEFYEKLAYDTYLIPYDTLTNTYWNDIQEAGYGQLQRRTLNTKGSRGEYTFSFGANYSNFLYLGATFGLVRLRFEKDIIHNEEDISNSIDFFDRFIFIENVRSSGTGYTFKLGGIVRPVNNLRIGLSYHFPEFFNLNDRFTTEMEGFYDPSEDIQPKKVYSPLGDYDYKLNTPSRFIASMAVILENTGLISIDYERVDFSKAKLNSSDYDFFNENATIKQLYKATNILRVGAELKIGTAYLRGGYSFRQSPYVSSEPNTKANLNIFSGGIGMRGRTIFVDFGYSISNSEEVYYMYLPQMTDGSRNKSIGNNMILTVGYKF